MAAKNVCLVGAGNIANTYAAVLATLPSVAVRCGATSPQ